jgi:hypothetical protein
MSDSIARIVFASWGKYGLRLEAKAAPTGTNYLLMSEIYRDASAPGGFRFLRRDFNEKQKETGKYNPHASFGLDLLPLVIAALVEYQKERGTDVAMPEAEAIVTIVEKDKRDEAVSHAMFEMAEFGPAKPKDAKKAPSSYPSTRKDDIPF